MSQWILLRGLTRETRHWGAFADDFRTRIADAGGVLAIDLPGNGTARAMRVPADVDGIAESVRSRAQAAGIAAPYRLFAMSLGAMVATQWAARHPGEIDRLVLINTSMRPFAGIGERLRPTAWPALVRVAACWTRGAQCERIVHALTCHRHDTLDADVAAWNHVRNTAPVSAASALRQLAAAARFRAPREAPCCPTLLLSSTDDRLVDPVCSARIAFQWGATHARHPWAGHDLPHDDPAWTCDTIADWLYLVDEAKHEASIRREPA
ncbi:MULTISPECIES: alpha/beta fold hydrolase [unclassified Caballeronia]|uniref:alpha/beta fold hydrolase n=1 Tax=unclassified Caballeronia TaxID=2646786 RepID=UPI0028552CD1|nr:MULTISPECIES: alpha/beta fold hydrolase [unclassified Caballeronia]MDR5754284.1 alpha/beta fold hydrolase [Caballeronia sp. LZ024]MDR5840662.1 alpha/beta fold hydrolase [Caballeronia sp. LZ031]